MSATNIDYDKVFVKHTVIGVPPNKTEQEIEDNAEYYQWRIYVDGKPEVLQKIAYVEYRLDPTFPRHVVVSRNWRRNFEYKIFGYGSFELEYLIHLKDGRPPLTGIYYLNIAKSNEIGDEVKIG